MECKVRYVFFTCRYVHVLIETLWNVKRKVLLIRSASAFGINRNIVECKAQGRRTPESPVHVLIETLWNVKIIIAIDANLISCINRNIVECKVKTAFLCFIAASVLIETLWNVKE